MKETFYFPHDNNAHNDPKIMSVFMETGLRGVGLYWILIEIMHQQENGMITHEQYKNYVKWYSSKENIGENLIEQLLNTCLTNGLFCRTDDDYIYSKRVLQNKTFRDDLIKKRSLAGKKSAEARANSTSVEQNGTSVEQGKGKGKGKERKIKVDNITTELEKISEEISLTPKKETEIFFETLEEKIEEITFSISPNIENHKLIKKELLAFARYWTEPNGTGKKQRWQMQQTFEVKRRLATWFSKMKQFSISNLSKNGTRFSD